MNRRNCINKINKNRDDKGESKNTPSGRFRPRWKITTQARHSGKKIEKKEKSSSFQNELRFLPLKIYIEEFVINHEHKFTIKINCAH